MCARACHSIGIKLSIYQQINPMFTTDKLFERLEFDITFRIKFHSDGFLSFSLDFYQHSPVCGAKAKMFRMPRRWHEYFVDGAFIFHKFYFRKKNKSKFPINSPVTSVLLPAFFSYLWKCCAVMFRHFCFVKFHAIIG